MLDVTQRFTHNAGFKLSTEKTNYICVKNSKGRTAKVGDKIQLSTDGTAIQRQPTVKTLGILLDENGKGDNWYLFAKKQWKTD